MKRFQGQYPVIHIRFGGIRGVNYKQILDEIKRSLNTSFNYHKLFYKNLLKKRIENYCENKGENISTENKALDFWREL